MKRQMLLQKNREKAIIIVGQRMKIEIEKGISMVVTTLLPAAVIFFKC